MIDLQRVSFLLLIALAILGMLFAAQTANAQTNYVTIYGQLIQSQCSIGTSGPCFSLITNGTTPGIPNYPALDFSQSVVPAPAQSDVGKTVSVIGYYGEETSCPIASGCPAFFVHTWGPYYQSTALSTTATCFSSLNSATTGVQCGTAPGVPLNGSSSASNAFSELTADTLSMTAAVAIISVAAYLLIHRKK